MRQSMVRQFVWQLVGLLLYLAGLLVFLFVVVGVFLSPPEYSIENLSIAHAPILLLSVGLLVLGRVISWKLGGGLSVGAYGIGSYGVHNQHPKQNQTVLEEYGYYNSPRESDSAENGDRDEDEFPVREYDGSTVYCEECGAGNDREFTYCHNCAAKLST